MSRQARVVLPGVPHHVTQRGNNRQSIFSTSADRTTYLKLLSEAAAESALEVHAYCLMTNHVHLVVTPLNAEDLSRTIQRAHLKYALYYNDARQQSGHLWQDRFYSCPLDEEHFWHAVRYVECNPIRAGLVARAIDYEWSSARAHVAKAGESRMLRLEKWRAAMAPEDWKGVLEVQQPEAEAQLIRGNTRTGKPLGTREFVSRAEQLLGRSLHSKPVGRPRE